MPEAACGVRCQVSHCRSACDLDNTRTLHLAGSLEEGAPILRLYRGRFQQAMKPSVRRAPTSQVELWFWKEAFIQLHDALE